MIPIIITDDYMKSVVEHSLANDKLLAFFLRKENTPNGEIEFYKYGTAVSIVRMLRNNDCSISLLLQGVSRIRIEKVIQHQPIIMATIETVNERETDSDQLRATRKIATELLEKIITESLDFNKELIFGLKSIKQHSRVADIIAGNLPFTPEVKQNLLETLDVKKRYEKLNKHLAEMIKQIRLESSIRNTVQLEIDEDQRRFYLREQLETIKRELGEFSDTDQDISNWFSKISKANLPEYVYETAREELNRISVMSTASSEYSVIRNYIEWLVNIPWLIYTKDRLDIPKIDSVLIADHYGLEKVKQRIIEYIAVKKLREINRKKTTKQHKSPTILCFVGPPGVGKTSMGRSIARAMNRKFIRMSLGGIHDEAEIRGHRRTYIGAMPGKVITEIKRCGSANPVFMLDEIDKVGKDFRGDPSSALLEVLDPEQNHAFMDNFLNLPFDLSKCFFITTANTLDTIPAALVDRMEIIEFTSYIEEEKIEIAKKYLIPKELEINGLTSKHVQFQTTAISEIIRYYVREAGVRSLQRNLASVMRKVAKKIAEKPNPTTDIKKTIITELNIKDFLGRRRFLHELAGRTDEIGIATGMAWTNFGGEILFCESSKMAGKGQLILTGSLGEVMIESAKLALSYIKANAQKYNIDPILFENFDIHIHVPAGAVPKDGPSAGVTLAISLISLFTQKKARFDIAMTGEITLFGRILSVGGISEKVLAAKRAGVIDVILPAESRDSFDEIPADAKVGMTVKYVKHIDEVIELVIL
jgi:ATP-dependent Lon protease